MEAVEEIDKTRYNIVMKNLTIGNVKLNGNVLLAPMAGFTSLPFRRLALEFGASLTFTEMVSAKACLFDNKKTMEILDVHESEKPCACQIFGSEPDVMSEAVKLPVFEKFDIIDINMGCPAPKIVSNGDGSALMKDIGLASRIIKACVASTNKPITVKFRSGYDDNSINAVEFAKMCEESGASAITIHGRTRTQMYGGQVDLDVIKSVKDAVNIPVIASGDVVDKASMDRTLEYTGCDAVMVGRGALGSPEIFADLTGGDSSKIDRFQLITKHIAGLREIYPENFVSGHIRKHLLWYLKGYAGSSKIKLQVSTEPSIDKVLEIIKEFMQNR